MKFVFCVRGKGKVAYAISQIPVDGENVVLPDVESSLLAPSVLESVIDAFLSSCPSISSLEPRLISQAATTHHFVFFRS